MQFRPVEFYGRGRRWGRGFALEKGYCLRGRAEREIMIRNGLYHCRTVFLDGVVGGSDSVMMLRDGSIRGGDSFYYFYGTYTSADGKVKGEITNLEHTASNGARPVWEKRVVTIGFSGTYNDETVESFGTSLVGKQSIRFNAKMRLLIPD